MVLGIVISRGVPSAASMLRGDSLTQSVFMLSYLFRLIPSQKASNFGSRKKFVRFEAWVLKFRISLDRSGERPKTVLGATLNPKP